MAEGFLPPEPPGPEPELGPPRAQPPPPQYAAPPPPPGYWMPQPTAWGYPPPPGNGQAVAGFICSIVAAGLLLITLFFSSIFSVALAIAGIYFSRKGKRKVDMGETPRHRGLAQAGFVTGIVTLVLAVLATLLIVLFIVVYATDEHFRDDFNNDSDGSGGTRSALLVAALAGRVVRLLSGL
jgi:hypothetical protein